MDNLRYTIDSTCFVEVPYTIQQHQLDTSYFSEAGIAFHLLKEFGLVCLTKHIRGLVDELYSVTTVINTPQFLR